MNTRTSKLLRLPLMIVAIVMGMALFQGTAAAQPCDPNVVRITIIGMNLLDLPLGLVDRFQNGFNPLPSYNQNSPGNPPSPYTYDEGAGGGGPTNLGAWTGVEVSGFGTVPVNGMRTYKKNGRCFLVTVNVDANGCRTITIESVLGPC